MKEVTITAFRRDMLFEVRDLPFVVMKEGEPLFVVSAVGQVDESVKVSVVNDNLLLRTRVCATENHPHQLSDICKVHNRPYKDCGCSLWS